PRPGRRSNCSPPGRTPAPPPRPTSSSRAELTAHPARDRRCGDTGTVTGNSAPPPSRWREIWPLAVVSSVTLAALLAFATGHGFHRDEFYIRESGRHLAWGYPDHPPLSPLLARLADELAPDSLLVLRTPPALGAAMTVLLIGLIAREFGGTRPAQFLAATVAAGSIIVLAGGHLLTTSSIDVVFATALDRKSTRLNSSHVKISYAVFCLK